MNSLQNKLFCNFPYFKPSIEENDGGGNAPTIFLACPSPHPNARRDKISRKGKPLTLMNQSNKSMPNQSPAQRSDTLPLLFAASAKRESPKTAMVQLLRVMSHDRLEARLR